MEDRVGAMRCGRGSWATVALILFGAVSSAQAETSSWEPGTEITTKRAIRTFAANGAEQCRDACLASTRCRAWNFAAPSAPRRQLRNRCEHFARVDGKRAVPGRSPSLAVAGVKSAKSDPSLAGAAAMAAAAEAGVKKGVTVLPSAWELARLKRRAAAVRAAVAAAAIKEGASAIEAESIGARMKSAESALQEASAADAVSAGASMLPSERTLARLSRESARQRATLVADTVKEGASALPSAAALARIQREASTLRDTSVAAAVDTGALALPSEALLARMRRETSALLGMVPPAGAEAGASVVSAAAALIRLQREVSAIAVAAAIGEGATALHSAAAQREARFATVTASVKEGASRVAAASARTGREMPASPAGTEIGGVREGAPVPRDTSPAAKPSEKETASPVPPARRSTWEPGLSLLGQAFAHDDGGAGAGAGYTLPEPEACRDLCLKHASCRWWKFNGAEYPHTTLRQLCFLFSGTPTRIGADTFGVISGVIQDAR
jgi:hypothetical protein